MKTIFKTTGNSTLVIEKAELDKMLRDGALVKICSNSRGSNTYYEIVDMDNTCLMSLPHDKYVTISRFIDGPAGRIDLIEKLSHFSWCTGRTGSNREHVMTSHDRKTIYMTRAIISIEKYSDIRELSSDCDVHHKGDVWDNRQGMIMYVEKLKHKHRRSHMTGLSVNSTIFNLIIERLIMNYQQLATLQTVA